MIRNKALYDSIDMYLKEGETKEGIMKQFKNNVVEAIKFLRTRSYEGLEVIERKKKDKPPVMKANKPKDAKKLGKAPKKSTKSTGQKDLF